MFWQVLKTNGKKLHLLKIRMGIDILSTEKCKFTFGLEYMLLDGSATENKTYPKQVLNSPSILT